MMNDNNNNRDLTLLEYMKNFEETLDASAAEDMVGEATYEETLIEAIYLGDEPNFVLQGTPYDTDQGAQIRADFSAAAEATKSAGDEALKTLPERASIQASPAGGAVATAPTGRAESAAPTGGAVVAAPAIGAAAGYGAAQAGRTAGYGSTVGYGSTASTRKKKKKNKKQRYITPRGLIAAMLCTMVATSALSIGGMYKLGAFDKVVVQEQQDPIGNAVVPPAGNVAPPAENYDLAKATGSPLSVQEIISKNEKAVVEIQTESVITDSWLQNYVTQGAGSGVVIDREGYIITCNHVIEGARSISVTMKDGTQYNAELVGTDPLTDVAVLKVEGNGLTAVSYGNSANLSIGDLVVAIGNPLGRLGGSATTGIISSLDRELTIDGKHMTLLQTDASINPGNSGGGLFDGNGNLIGVVVAKSSGSDIEGLGFAIPINTAAAIATELIEYGTIKGRAMIGVNIVDLTDASLAMQYGVRNTGIYISDVTGKEAQEAGFMSGDMIYYVGDYEITSDADLRSALAQYEPGDEVLITVIRNNRTVDILTVLTEAQ